VWDSDAGWLVVTHMTKGYTTGTGQKLYNVHKQTDDCYKYGCVIHSPSVHHMREWKTHWRGDRGIMERLCPTHGTGHPDPDDNAYIRRRFGDAEANTRGIHGCCSCCWPLEPDESLLQPLLERTRRSVSVLQRAAKDALQWLTQYPARTAAITHTDTQNRTIASTATTGRVRSEPLSLNNQKNAN